MREIPIPENISSEQYETFRRISESLDRNQVPTFRDKRSLSGIQEGHSAYYTENRDLYLYTRCGGKMYRVQLSALPHDDTNAFTDALLAKLDSLKVLRTAQQTFDLIEGLLPEGVELRTASEAYALIRSLLDYDDLLNQPTIPSATQITQQIANAIMAAPDEVGLTNAEVQTLITAAVMGFLDSDEISTLIANAVVNFRTATQITQQIANAIMAAPDEVGLTNAEVQTLITAAVMDFLDSDEISTLIANAFTAPVWSTISTESVANGASFSINLSDHATAEIGVITFAVSGLPSGLSLSGSVISGSSTVTGTHTITVTASSAFGSAETTFDLTIDVSVPVWSTVPNITYTYNVSVSLALAGYVTDEDTITASGLPSGLSINSSGQITGQSTDTGASVVTLTAANSSGSASTTFTITIRDQFGFYLLDNTADELTFVRFDGTEVTSKNVDLPSGAYYGAYARITSNYATVITSNRDYRDIDLRNGDVDEEYRLPSGSWQSMLDDDWLLDDGNNRLRYFIIDFDDDDNLVLVEEPDSFSLGAGSWVGGTLNGSSAYLLNTSGSPDHIHIYNTTDGTEHPDSPASLPTGQWTDCVWHDGRLYIIDLSGTDSLRVFEWDNDFNLVEDTNAEIMLPSGNYRDVFVHV